MSGMDQYLSISIVYFRYGTKSMGLVASGNRCLKILGTGTQEDDVYLSIRSPFVLCLVVEMGRGRVVEVWRGKGIKR